MDGGEVKHRGGEDGRVFAEHCAGRKANGRDQQKTRSRGGDVESAAMTGVEEVALTQRRMSGQGCIEEPVCHIDEPGPDAEYSKCADRSVNL